MLVLVFVSQVSAPINLVSTHFGVTTTVLFLIDIQSGSVTGRDTMRTRDPIFQANLGQRTGASFQDIKVINWAYCNSESSRYCNGLIALDTEQNNVFVCIPITFLFVLFKTYLDRISQFVKTLFFSVSLFSY